MDYLGYSIRYMNADGKIVTEMVVAEPDERTYQTISGKVVSKTRVNQILRGKWDDSGKLGD